MSPCRLWHSARTGCLWAEAVGQRAVRGRNTRIRNITPWRACSLAATQNNTAFHKQENRKMKVRILGSPYTLVLCGVYTTSYVTGTGRSALVDKTGWTSGCRWRKHSQVRMTVLLLTSGCDRRPRSRGTRSVFFYARKMTKTFKGQREHVHRGRTSVERDIANANEQ